MKHDMTTLQRRAVNRAVRAFRQHGHSGRHAGTRVEFHTEGRKFTQFTLELKFTGEAKGTMLEIVSACSASFSVTARGKLELYSYIAFSSDREHTEEMRQYLATAAKASIPNWAR